MPSDVTTALAVMSAVAAAGAAAAAVVTAGVLATRRDVGRAIMHVLHDRLATLLAAPTEATTQRGENQEISADAISTLVDEVEAAFRSIATQGNDEIVSALGLEQTPHAKELLGLEQTLRAKELSVQPERRRDEPEPAEWLELVRSLDDTVRYPHHALSHKPEYDPQGDLAQLLEGSHDRFARSLYGRELTRLTSRRHDLSASLPEGPPSPPPRRKP